MAITLESIYSHAVSKIMYPLCGFFKIRAINDDKRVPIRIILHPFFHNKLVLFPGILTHCLILAATPEEITPSLDEAYRKIEEAALQRRSS